MVNCIQGRWVETRASYAAPSDEYRTIRDALRLQAAPGEHSAEPAFVPAILQERYGHGDAPSSDDPYGLRSDPPPVHDPYGRRSPYDSRPPENHRYPVDEGSDAERAPPYANPHFDSQRYEGEATHAGRRRRTSETRLSPQRFEDGGMPADGGEEPEWAASEVAHQALPPPPMPSGLDYPTRRPARGARRGWAQRHAPAQVAASNTVQVIRTRAIEVAKDAPSPRKTKVTRAKIELTLSAVALLSAVVVTLYFELLQRHHASTNRRDLVDAVAAESAPSAPAEEVPTSRER